MSRRGCFRNTFFGCFSLIFFIAVIFFALLVINLPDIDFSSTLEEKESYIIVYDSLSHESVINSSFNWSFVSDNLSKKRYSITFRLLERNVKDAMDFIVMLSKMSYRDLGINLNKRYTDSETESRVVWAEVYKRVFYQSFDKINPILSGFNKIFIDQKLGSKDKVYFIISFVQNIPYDRPGGALDLFPPIGTIANRFGDCDSKSLLLYVILEKMNIDCAMFWSSHYKHAMLGLNVPARGEFKTVSGKKYYFLETTFPGWNIGELPPDFDKVRYWYLKEIDNVIVNTHENYEDTIKPDTGRKNKPSPSK